MENGTAVIVNEEYSGWEWEGTIIGRKDEFYLVKDQEDNVFDVEFWLVRDVEDYKLKLEACDLIEELLTMLRMSDDLTEEQMDRLDEIEDFSVNYLGED